MNWIIIALAVILIFIVLKFKEFRHKFGFLLILFVLLFLGISFWNVSRTHDVNITNFDGVVQAGKVYFLWMGSMFTNAKEVTGYAIHQDWGIKEVVNIKTQNITDSANSIANNTG